MKFGVNHPPVANWACGKFLTVLFVVILQIFFVSDIASISCCFVAFAGHILFVVTDGPLSTSGTRMSFGIAQFYLPPDIGDVSAMLLPTVAGISKTRMQMGIQ